MFCPFYAGILQYMKDAAPQNPLKLLSDDTICLLKHHHNLLPLAIEGMNQGRWVLLDYGEIMVHVFQQPVREFYDLEGLWSEAPKVELAQTADQ